jgi:2-oxoglutarate ferredoxin oxidoreductase subunit gamma
MSKHVEIIISGVGGQGIVVGGAILGKAAVEYAGKNAVSTSEYGVETRGTFTKSSVIISDGEIYYTDTVNPDLVIALANIAYEKFAEELNGNTVLIFDNSKITKEKKTICTQIGFPISRIAKDLGNETAANLVALGIIVKKTNLVEKKFIENIIKEKFKKNNKISQVNLQAFNKGYDIA